MFDKTDEDEERYIIIPIKIKTNLKLIIEVI